HQDDKGRWAFARRLTRDLSDTDRARDALRRHAPLDNSLNYLAEQERAFCIFVKRLVQSRGQRKPGCNEIDLLLRSDADHPFGGTIQLGVDGLDSDLLLLAVSLELNRERFAGAPFRYFVEFCQRVNGLPVYRSQKVALFEARLFGRVSRFHG